MSEKTGNELVKSDQEAAIMKPESSLLFDDAKFFRMEKLAEIMSSGKSTVPAHFRGSVGDCFAVVMQAAQWGMNPFAVAQKTHLVNGVLGYEAQLVNSVLSSNNAIKGHFNFEYQWDDNALNGLIRCGAVLKGENEITWGEWLDTKTVSTKNSPLWKTAPKQQAAYLVIKYWSRLYAPAAIMGVYTQDELEEIKPPMKNITPEKENPDTKQTEGLLDKLQKKDKTTKVDVEIVEEQQTITQIIEAEIKKSKAPIVLADINDYLKKEKAAGPDVEAVCKKSKEWNGYVRKNFALFVKAVGEWKAGQAEQ